MRSSQKAFSLIELMVTLAVLGLIVGFAIPSFNSAILNNKSVALAEDFSTELNFARSEAIKRATRVSLCASDNSTSCTGNWSDGFIVFIDTATSNEATAPVVVATNILHKWKKPDPRVSISVKKGATSTNATFIRYTSLGTLARVDGTSIVATTQMQGCTGDAARKITIGLSGLISTGRDTCQ